MLCLPIYLLLSAGVRHVPGAAVGAGRRVQADPAGIRRIQVYGSRVLIGGYYRITVVQYFLEG